MKYLLSLFTLTFLCVLHAEMIKAPNLACMKSHFESLDNEALVVFDVDCTLIVPKDKILSPAGYDYINNFRRQGRETLGNDRMDELASIVLLQRECELINEDILPLIARLKERGIKVIALTAVKTGAFGRIPNMEDWRINHLASINFSFKEAFPNCPSFTLEKCQGQKEPAVFKEGILFSGKYPKGEVLCAFLEKMQYRPSQIVFIDDVMEFVESVELHCEKANIPHISFHYTEAADANPQINFDVASLQLKHLIEKEEWLSDEKAKFLLDSCHKYAKNQYRNNDEAYYHIKPIASH